MCKGNGTIQFLKGTKTMKKIFAIALAVVMVLSIASVAGAFNWSKPAAPAEPFGYSVDVIKFTRSTGELGSSYFNADDAATAVNGADVYYAIRLVVPDLATDNAVRKNAKVSVSITALDGVKDMPATAIGSYSAGIYYYGTLDKGDNYGFYTIEQFKQNKLGMNHTAETPVFAARCLDTATAKVSAKVTSKPNLWTTYTSPNNTLSVGGFKVFFNKGANAIGFLADDDTRIVDFYLNGDSLVTKAQIYSRNDNKLFELYRWLNNGDAQAIETAINNKEMYMTDDNLLAAFGFNYKVEDSVTWNANSTPIILDPTVSIPKTGDNASVIGFAMIMVIGFAMIMVAVVAAAVAVRKVNA